MNSAFHHVGCTTESGPALLVRDHRRPNTLLKCYCVSPADFQPSDKKNQTPRSFERDRFSVVSVIHMHKMPAE